MWIHRRVQGAQKRKPLTPSALSVTVSPASGTEQAQEMLGGRADVRGGWERGQVRRWTDRQGPPWRLRGARAVPSSVAPGKLTQRELLSRPF